MPGKNICLIATVLPSQLTLAARPSGCELPLNQGWLEHYIDSHFEVARRFEVFTEFCWPFNIFQSAAVAFSVKATVFHLKRWRFATKAWDR
jgi:hypothetical protein